MKLMVLRTLAAFTVLFSGSSVYASDYTRFYSSGNIFSISLPSNWKQTDKEKRFAIESVNGNVSVNATAYKKENCNFERFAKVRWDGIKKDFPFYKQISGPYVMQFSGMKAEAVEYEGVWPGDKSPTYYFVVCAQAAERFISLAFTMTQKEYVNNFKQYKAFAQSLQFEK